MRAMYIKTERYERAVMGAVLLSGETAYHEAESMGLSGDHFGVPVLSKLWRAVGKDIQEGIVPTAAVIFERHAPSLKEAGGYSWLIGLMDDCPSAVQLPTYVDQLLEGDRKRRLVLAAEQLIEAAKTPSSKAEELEAIIERAVADSVRESGGSVELDTAATIVQGWLDHKHRVLLGEVPDNELKWGLRAVDRFVTAGPGHLVVIGGRPKMGKSQLAMSLMSNIARHHGPTLFCSAEMGREALARRIASSSMDITNRDPERFHAASAAVFDEWAGVPMFFDYRARTVGAVATSIRSAHRKYGIQAAAIDYLQLLDMDDARTEEEEIGRASKRFKLLAEELEIPVVLLVQVNRRCEERADKRPIMSDIRGSGRVEQDADAVVFVYREVSYNERFPRPNQVELLVRANRHGPSGTGISYWKPGGGWFRDPQPWEIPNREDPG